MRRISGAAAGCGKVYARPATPDAITEPVSFLALIPARSGSLRVPEKNVRRLAGHPLLAYAIAAARQSGVFSRVVVSTDSAETRELALAYGAEAPFIRPAELATAVSIDIEWITHAVGELRATESAFAIVRPTSPFRGAATIVRAVSRFLELSHSHDIDSLRAVEPVKQHPGKMWVIDGEVMRPLLDQSQLEVAWHAQQYQSLPLVHVQNSALEIAWMRVIADTGTREGRVIAPFLTEGYEGLAIDTPEDWERAERLAAEGVPLPAVEADA